MQTTVDTRNNAPAISVIIPTFNRRDLLELTLDSLTAQSLHDWETIVVDDGSTDGTLEYLDRCRESNSRIRFVRRSGEERGANVCRNQGAKLASAELLVFLDSDDLLAVDCLEHRVAWMNRNQDIDFAVCHASAFVETPEDLKRPASHHSLEGDLDRFLYFDLPWLITGPTWRKSAFWKLGGFNEQIPSWQDVELHVRAILTGMRYQNLPRTDYHVRWQNDPSKTSLQQRRNEHHLRAGELTIDKFEELLNDKSQLTWSRLRGIAYLRLLLAEMWMNLNHSSEALRVWRRIKSSPGNSAALYYGGLSLLLAKRLGISNWWIVDRLNNRWRGAVRLRNQPRLVTNSSAE